MHNLVTRFKGSTIRAACTVTLMLAASVNLVASGNDHKFEESTFEHRLDISLDELEAHATKTLLNAHAGPVVTGGTQQLVRSDCSYAPSISAVRDSARKVLAESGFELAYDSVRAEKVTMVTNPRVIEGDAHFYFYSAIMDQCPGTTCTVNVRADLVISSIREGDGILLVSQAKYRNDELSGRLVNVTDALLVTCGG